MNKAEDKPQAAPQDPRVQFNANLLQSLLARLHSINYEVTTLDFSVFPAEWVDEAKKLLHEATLKLAIKCNLPAEERNEDALPNS